SFVGDQNEDDEEDEAPAPKRPRREVAALQSSPPQPVASSSKTRSTPSHGKTQPVASSSKIPLPKMDVPYVAVPPSEHKRKRDPPISNYHPQPLPSPPPAPAYAPPAQSMVQETPAYAAFGHPLPATQLVPTSFVQDGLAPALYSKGPFKCHACIVLNKLCHSRGMNVPCEECNSSKHKCSIVASPVRFLQNLEELRPMMNLGPEVLSRALLNSIELRRDCDMLYAQLLSVDEVVLRFSNMDDILPEDYVRFGFENPVDVDLLRTISDHVRSTRLPQPDLENHPTTDILARRVPGDPTTTNEYYLPTEPPLSTEVVTMDDMPAIASFGSSIFAGHPPRVPAPTAERPGTTYPPSAAVPTAFSQPHASPETYTVNPSSTVPSNAPPAPQNPAAASSTPAAAAGFHSLSTRPFGGAGSLLQSGATPAPWNQPPVSPGQGAAGPSGSGA
ncbi:hypothetical protein B0H13DRAFT_1936722, partial [Mycena leptocephala]